MLHHTHREQAASSCPSMQRIHRSRLAEAWHKHLERCGCGWLVFKPFPVKQHVKAPQKHRSRSQMGMLCRMSHLTYLEEPCIYWEFSLLDTQLLITRFSLDCSQITPQGK